MQTAFKFLQQPTTFVTAMAVVLVTIVIVSPKWLDWWLKWHKWRHSQKERAAVASGTIASQTFDQKTNRRLWQKFEFWGQLLDMLLGFAAMMLLLSVVHDDGPATRGHVALCAALAAGVVLSGLRRW